MVNYVKDVYAKGWRDAEHKVDEILDKNPDLHLRVYINGKHAYNVSWPKEDRPR